MVPWGIMGSFIVKVKYCNTDEVLSIKPGI